MGYGQKIEKKIIYIKFEKTEKCNELLKFYYQEEKGIVLTFFCSGGNSFLYKSKSDTLPISKIAKYKISTFEEIEILEKQWRKKSKKALIKKYGKLYPPFDKNGIFQTYLIEIISDKQFVIYPVKWRNLEIESDGEEPPKR
ncbi:hypothetical protein B0E44_05825 [Flavobacterium sp. A45]|nr:hypothetical protein B0E44_05825 [Flavobacterium sp. A45]